ncbi:E3 ubiquitin-protein ligase RMA3 [Abeliophyllum distichum]|uniref:E3 ubiquitin-protein ligase RMA n=1 Tax=Abeliophyllum distichum TaxID=126358 RepID=A0ABD1QGM7_9LAMI
MAFQQYFVLATDSEKTSACFDCSICLDFACDPVVTLCGHLYCWPCIYKWFQSASLDSEEQLPRCPVCKAEISEKFMVPLYGRGQCLSETEHEGKNIPPRPPARGIKELEYLYNPDQQPVSRDPYQNLHNPYPSNEGVTSSPFDLSNPSIGMFGEMVYARVFGNSERSIQIYRDEHSDNRAIRKLEKQKEL